LGIPGAPVLYFLMMLMALAIMILLIELHLQKPSMTDFGVIPLMHYAETANNQYWQKDKEETSNQIELYCG
jgi:ABC-type transport system involved in multi-copper enzyme maturation permease subunit